MLVNSCGQLKREEIKLNFLDYSLQMKEKKQLVFQYFL